MWLLSASGPLHMSILLSLPGKSYSSFSVDRLFPPSQADCPTDQTPQRAPFTKTTVCTASHGDPILGSAPTPFIPRTGPAHLLHSNAHVSNPSFVKCPSSPLDCQGRDCDFPVHPQNPQHLEQCLCTQKVLRKCAWTECL